ncbi:MAG TPA: NAD(+)/NADH kinase [Ignavibacteria bacterium]|nr:NAD(+)/NADH kinase [Ignavibacteria bacterium]
MKREINNIKIGIFGNTSKDEVSKLLNKILEYLIDIKSDFLIDEDLIKLTSSKFKKYSSSKKNILDTADYIFSLGGDGTFLNTARIVGDRNIPILGINLGRLGFFSEITPDEFKDFIPKLVQGKFKIVEQVIIKSVYKNKVFYGLNDIVIDKSDSIRMIETETYYNGEKVVKCISDGIIVSTPAGSTGYSLSCNGPIVNPKSSVFVITPISPHTFNVRPIIIPDSGEIRIIVPNQGKTRITADGQIYAVINSPSEIILTKADYTIKVIKKLNSTYFQTLKKKLFWNVDKRYS